MALDGPAVVAMSPDSPMSATTAVGNNGVLIAAQNGAELFVSDHREGNVHKVPKGGK
jgi:hypothetical protein